MMKLEASIRISGKVYRASQLVFAVLAISTLLFIAFLQISERYDPLPNSPYWVFISSIILGNSILEFHRPNILMGFRMNAGKVLLIMRGLSNRYCKIVMLNRNDIERIDMTFGILVIHFHKGGSRRFYAPSYLYDYSQFREAFHKPADHPLSIP